MSHHALIQQFFDDLFSRGEPDCAENIAAPMYVENAVAPFVTDEPRAVPGPQHLRDTASWVRGQFPDWAMTGESMLTEGDRRRRPRPQPGNEPWTVQGGDATSRAPLRLPPGPLVPHREWPPRRALGNPRGPPHDDSARSHPGAGPPAPPGAARPSDAWQLHPAELNLSGLISEYRHVA